MEGGGMGTLILFCIGMVIYFAPWIIALKSNHKNHIAVFFLNLLLGWTFVGWVGVLVWVITGLKDRTTEERDTKPCPKCAETVEARAVVCSSCGHAFAAAKAPAPRRSSVPSIRGPLTAEAKPPGAMPEDGRTESRF